MKKYLPFILMFLGCITWGRGNHSDFLYYTPSVLLLLIAALLYASSKNSSFVKELRILAIIILVLFAFNGGHAILKNVTHLSNSSSVGLLISGSLRLAGSFILLLENITFIKEYSDKLKSKISNPNS